MNIQQLKYIIEIERSGSINQAAKNLLISQPWLSTSIRELEQELNFFLFDRTSKGVTLTIEGKEFIENAKPLLSQIDRIQNLYDYQNKKNIPPILRVSSGKYSFITSICIDYYKKYFETSPNFTIYTDESNCQTVVSNIFNLKFEIGIIHISDKNDGNWKQKLSNKEIEFHFLFRSISYIILRKGHPLLDLKFLDVEDLYEYPLFHSNGKTSTLAHFDETPDLFPYENFKRNIYTNNRNNIFDFISNSNAIFIGNSNFDVEKLHPCLTTIPYPQYDISWSFYWIKLKNKKLSDNAQKFISLIENYNPNC